MDFFVLCQSVSTHIKKIISILFVSIIIFKFKAMNGEKIQIEVKLIKKSINYICRNDIHTISLVFFISLLTEVFYKKPYISSTLKDINYKKWVNNYQYLGDIIVINIEMYNK